MQRTMLVHVPSLAVSWSMRPITTRHQLRTRIVPPPCEERLSAAPRLTNPAPPLRSEGYSGPQPCALRFVTPAKPAGMFSHPPGEFHSHTSRGEPAGLAAVTWPALAEPFPRRERLLDVSLV